MGSGVRGGAVLAPRRKALGRVATSLPIDPSRGAGGVETTAATGKRRFPEIDCIRAFFSPAVIAAAEQRAEAIGIGADRVLIASGRLEEEAYLRILGATLGYHADIIESTTYEEAPTHFAAWLRQRTRWFKGWMQTWLVHMREPGKLLRELGLPGFLAFQLMIGGSALAALVHPPFMAGLIYAIASGGIGWRDNSTMVALPAAFYVAIALFGYLSSAFLGWLGLSRRGLSGAAWVLLLTPVHWLLLSLAAWRALYQLFFAPYRWEKTTHGLAKSSHRADKMTRALLELEREVEALKKSGKMPTLGDPPTYISAIRRRSLRDSVSD